MKLLIPIENSGVQYWRTRTPIWELEKLGLVETRYFEARQFTSKEVADGLQWCDLVILRGCADTTGLSLLRNYQKLGKPCAVDQDDYNFEVDPLNPAYKRFGTEEIDIKTEHGESSLWKDGVDGFDLKKNRIKAGAGLTILQESALLTTTTPYLKSKFKKLCGREDIQVIPNAVNKSLWKPLYTARDKYKDGFRFGWFISDSHGSDLLYIRGVLRDFLNKHKDAKLVIMGDYGGVCLDDYFPKEQIETYGWCDLYADHYPTIASCMGLDVAIAPLAHNEFNRCKSPLKFAEYTYLGYPTILENIETYSPYVCDGESALLAGSESEWISALEKMYSDKNLRSKLHFNALEVCDLFFDNAKVCHQWYAAFKWILDREELTV